MISRNLSGSVRVHSYCNPYFVRIKINGIQVKVRVPKIVWLMGLAKRMAKPLIMRPCMPRDLKYFVNVEPML